MKFFWFYCRRTPGKTELFHQATVETWTIYTYAFDCWLTARRNLVKKWISFNLMYGFLKRERAIWCNSYSTRSTDSWDLIDLQNSAASFCSQCYYQESHWKYTELLEIFYHPKNQEYEKSFKKRTLKIVLRHFSNRRSIQFASQKETGESEKLDSGFKIIRKKLQEMSIQTKTKLVRKTAKESPFLSPPPHPPQYCFESAKTFLCETFKNGNETFFVAEGMWRQQFFTVD